MVRWSLCTLDSFSPQLFLVGWIYATFVLEERRSIRRMEPIFIQELYINDVTLKERVKGFVIPKLCEYSPSYSLKRKKSNESTKHCYKNTVSGWKEEVRGLPVVLARAETLSFQAHLRGSTQSLGTWILFMSIKRENYWQNCPKKRVQKSFYIKLHCFWIREQLISQYPDKCT